MTIEEFERDTAGDFEGALLALWCAGKGDWQRAHTIAQAIETAEGAWVHAHLHRAEGDASNAAYWYRRAGRPVASGELRAEWEAMMGEMLPRGER